MLTVGLFVRLEAKPDKAEAVAAFLMQGLQLANQETTTPLWFALRLGPTTFAIFDAFDAEPGRQAHLAGPIAQALMANAPNLLATAPVIETSGRVGCQAPQIAANVAARHTENPCSGTGVEFSGHPDSIWSYRSSSDV